MEMQKGRTSLWLGAAALGCLVLASLWLGVNRIFQVDEVQYSAMARFMATGRTVPFVSSVPLILVGPVTWIARSAADSAGVLVRIRLPFVALMWVNALLTVKGAGLRLRSREGLFALLLVSTLAPMWDYGFEIRHDVPLVTATLALWCLIRAERPSPATRLLLAGMVAGLMQLIAFKGFMLALPLLALGVWLARPRSPRRALADVGIILAGILAGLLAGRLMHGLAGTWELAWAGFKGSGGTAAAVDRFSPWATLRRFLSEAPLLACGSLAALALPFLPAEGRRPGGLDAFPALPEWCFALLCVVMFFANPTPFPYNLLHLVPALAILLLRLHALQPALLPPPPMRRLVLGTLLLLHGVPWALATWRHVDRDNGRQLAVIRAAEALTDPALHCVFDGSGLVSTRNPPGEHWLLHTFTIEHFQDGTWPSVRSLLASKPTPVILTSYRTAGLPQEDQAFIKEHYIPLADDFAVLGVLLTPGSSTWEPLAEGRYQATLTAIPPGKVPSFNLEVTPSQTTVLVLGRAPYVFNVPPGHQLRIAWLGPRLESLPRLGPAPHALFMNWY